MTGLFMIDMFRRKLLSPCCSTGRSYRACGLRTGSVAWITRRDAAVDQKNTILYDLVTGCSLRVTVHGAGIRYTKVLL